jgi:exodeoxyribonuclease VII large subunit
MDNVISAMRLSELSGKIVQVVDAAFRSASFWVIADVTNHTFKPSSQYHYFELVEKDPGSNNLIAKFSAKSWGTGSQRITNFERVTGQRFQNNINVLINVTIAYHATYGLQLTLIDIDTNYTVGVLEQQRQATLGRLLRENPDHIKLTGDRYQTTNHNLSFNKVIQRIAIISSDTSAGYQDFNHTLENNTYKFKFFIDNYFANIQGDNNAKQFVDKLIEIYQSGIKYDALVIIRGGGAQTDLMIFDNYAISRAIARFPIPIITGIGHQKNETIADIMANTATKTPTKAAEFILAHNKLFEDRLLNFQKTIVIKSQQIFSVQDQALSTLNSIVVNNALHYIGFHKDILVKNNQLIINTTKSILFSNKTQLFDTATQLLSRPKMIIYNKKSDLKNICNNLNTFNAMYLKNQRGYLGHYVSVFKLMSPANILSKGFAIIKVNCEITSDTNTMTVGQDISILIGRKEIDATIKLTKEYNGSEFNI